jgi:hypothetical protein
MSGPRLREAKAATVAAIDCLPDGVRFGLVAGSHVAEVVYPGTPPLAVSSASTRHEAKEAVRRLEAGGGTAIGAWIDCCARILGAEPGIETYDQFKKYNLDLLLKWRNFPKPTVAMVEGYCIYAGWMLAAAMDVIFAAEDAEFLGGFVEYNTIPWDIGVRRAKELVFESRFISAEEAAGYGLVNRVLPAADLERQTFAWARRAAASVGRATQQAESHSKAWPAEPCFGRAAFRSERTSPSRHRLRSSGATRLAGSGRGIRRQQK